MRLDQEMTSLVKEWAAIFVWCLVNLISKLELHCNNALIDVIIEHNSDLPWGLDLMASTTTLESLSKQCWTTL
jgi:hypothetical protein